MYDDQLYSISAGFSPHIVTGNGNLDSVLKHDLYHLGHSRALNDLFLLNYGLQGLNALLLKGNFVDERNYYEDFVNYYPWWDTHPVWQ
ncbi:hypothetical protein [Prevotella histicola]|uniref:hypothetical protein n=1 Tax=Prevotella histicola TaxID=470565 RepID=UPI0028DB6175|nr:hypothetical protein [Prevotella histicola]